MPTPDDFAEITGGDITISASNLVRTRRYRAKSKLPWQSPSGDYFDRMADYVTQWVQAYALIYPTPYGTLVASEIRQHEVNYAQNYNFTVVYTKPNADGENQVGAYSITMDASGGSVNVKYGKCIGVFAKAGGDKPSGLVGKPAAIGKRGREIAGVDIPIPQPRISVMFRHPKLKLTRSYIRSIEKLVGYPNNDTFLGYDPGEVIYRSGPLTETNVESTAVYNFDVSYNVTSLDIGSGANKITIDKKGWDVLDPVFEPDVVNNLGVKVVKYFQTIRPGKQEWKDYKSVFGWGH